MWFILLFLITTATAAPTRLYPRSATNKIIYYDSVLGYPCESNNNCGGLVGSSMCYNGKYVCQSGYIPKGIMHCVYTGGENNFSLDALIFCYNLNMTFF